MIISILQGEKNGLPGITPELVSVLCQNRHTVLIEGDSDHKDRKLYLAVGAYIINTKEELLDRGDLILKKEPILFQDIDSVHGEEKIFFTTIDINDKKLVQKALVNEISIINFLNLPGLNIKKMKTISSAEFSHYITPFILSLAGKGLKALVDDEILRDALLVMGGKAYSGTLAELHHLQCYEY